MKVPKVPEASDSDDGEAVAESEEEGAYVDIGIPAENSDYLADSEESKKEVPFETKLFFPCSSCLVLNNF